MFGGGGSEGLVLDAPLVNDHQPGEKVMLVQPSRAELAAFRRQQTDAFVRNSVLMPIVDAAAVFGEELVAARRAQRKYERRRVPRHLFFSHVVFHSHVGAGDPRAGARAACACCPSSVAPVAGGGRPPPRRRRERRARGRAPAEQRARAVLREARGHRPARALRPREPRRRRRQRERRAARRCARPRRDDGDVARRRQPVGAPRSTCRRALRRRERRRPRARRRRAAHLSWCAFAERCLPDVAGVADAVEEERVDGVDARDGRCRPLPLAEIAEVCQVFRLFEAQAGLADGSGLPARRFYACYLELDGLPALQGAVEHVLAFLAARPNRTAFQPADLVHQGSCGK